MNTGPPDLVVTATITPTGVLTVWGLGPSPRVLDEGAPGAARNALVNLLRTHALATTQAVCAVTRTPAGPWYVACDPDGMASPVDPSRYAHVVLPDLDPEVALAGTAAVFADAADSPPVAMLALATDPDPTIRAEALIELANWPDDPTSVAVAELPADRLERLARCDLAWVRVGVAANPRTDPSTLAHLVTDPDPQVLAALAARFDLDLALLVQLASSPDPVVQAELARNPAAAFLTAAHPIPAPPSGDGTVERRADPALATLTRPNPPDGPPPTPRPPIPTAAVAAPARTRFPRRAAVALGAAAAVVLLTVGGYTAVTTRGSDPAPAVAVSATVPWNGMSLPTGPDGPDDPAGPVATGFAHTDLGAALAAAHLSVRIDPYAGPASFDPTISGQTFGGDPAALLGATRDRYDTAAARAGITDGGPIPTSTGQITGWRIDGWTPDAPATVHLRVTGADGSATDYAIAVVWVDGDYQLLDPTRADTFATSPAADPATYRRF